MKVATVGVGSGPLVWGALEMCRAAKLVVLLAGALVGAPADLLAADSSHKSAACARCIGDLCLRPKQMSDKELVQLYGPGEIRESAYGGIVDTRTRCYFDGAQRLWVLADIYHNNDPPHMYVVGVGVSQVSLCGKAVSSRRPFPKLALSGAIAIGDSESSVLAKCGEPDRVDDLLALERRDPRLKDEPGFGSKFGERKLVYLPEGEDSLLTLFVQVSNGRVKSLWLTESP